MQGTKPRPLPALTGLRFFAAFYVVVFHLAPPSWRQGLAGRVIAHGDVGVNLFFVLSGFILAYNYLGAHARPSGRDFWSARLARVYPVYLLGLLVSLPHFLYAERAHGMLGAGTLTAIPAALGLVQSWVPPLACRFNCPGWSLSAEAFFYLMFPLVGMLVAGLRPARLAAVGAAAWVASLLPVAIATAAAPTLAIDGETGVAALLKFNPALRLPEFVVGVACGCLFMAKQDEWSAGRWSWAATGTTLLTLGALAFLPQPLEPFIHVSLLTPVFAALVLSLAFGGGPLGAALGRRPVVLLGEASYALYILHVPLAQWWNTAAHALRLPATNTTVGNVAYSLCAVAASVVVLRRFEEPWRRRIRAWSAGPGAYRARPTRVTSPTTSPVVPGNRTRVASTPAPNV